MRLIRLIWIILKDERGVFPAWGAAAIMGGSSLLGGLLGGGKKKVYDPYEGLRGKYTEYAQGKLGAKTPYQYNPAFALQQPGVEQTAESTILGKLSNLPTPSGFSKDITEKYKGYEKKAAQEEWEAGLEEEQNIYNRLGLVSSTPWLERYGEKRGELEDVLGGIESRYAYEDIGRELEAERMANEIANQWVSQAQILGGKQRGYQQFPMQMSMQDIMRMSAEEQGWGGQIAGLLGANPPQMYSQPNIWSQLAGTGQDIGSMLMLQSILGGGK